MYDNLFEVYRCVEESAQPTSCEAIANETNLSVRTVQRVTKTWVKQGFFDSYSPAKSNCRLYSLKSKKPTSGN